MTFGVLIEIMEIEGVLLTDIDPPIAGCPSVYAYMPCSFPLAVVPHRKGGFMMTIVRCIRVIQTSLSHLGLKMKTGEWMWHVAKALRFGRHGN